MWWSVPKGVTEFSTWRELTTVYHEGVPGHHLQIAQTVYRARPAQPVAPARRAGSSGHGEGWALYAEWLMADLGFLDDPADYLGHAGRPVAARRAGRDRHRRALRASTHRPRSAAARGPTTRPGSSCPRTATSAEGVRRFELDRYLGWPGPGAVLQDRRAALAAAARRGARPARATRSTCKAFHRRALDVGSVGLDVLRTALLDGYA